MVLKWTRRFFSPEGSGKPFGRKSIFCPTGNATNGSALRVVQKSFLFQKLEADSRNSYHKKSAPFEAPLGMKLTLNKI